MGTTRTWRPTLVSLPPGQTVSAHPAPLLLHDSLSCRGSRDPRWSRRTLTGQTLTDGARASPRVLLKQLHDVGFLRGRAAAAHHGRALAGQLRELKLVELEADLRDRAS